MRNISSMASRTAGPHGPLAELQAIGLAADVDRTLSGGSFTLFDKTTALGSDGCKFLLELAREGVIIAGQNALRWWWHR